MIMGTEKDSPKERLLEACGSEKAPPALPGSQGQQREKYFEAMLAKADIAAKLAQQAQGETEKNYQKLNSFLERDLPGRLQSAIDIKKAKGESPHRIDSSESENV